MELSEQFISELSTHLDDLITQGYDFQYKIRYDFICIDENLESYPKIYIRKSHLNINSIFNYYITIIYSKKISNDIKYSTSLEELLNNIRERIEELGIGFNGNPILK